MASAKRAKSFQISSADRLTEIERRLAGRAKEIAGVEARHGDAGFGEVLGEHDPVGHKLAVERGEVDALEHVGCVGRLEEERVGGLARPAGHVLCADVGGIELGADHLGPAVLDFEGLFLAARRQRLLRPRREMVARLAVLRVQPGFFGRPFALVLSNDGLLSPAESVCEIQRHDRRQTDIVGRLFLFRAAYRDRHHLEATGGIGRRGHRDGRSRADIREVAAVVGVTGRIR